MNHISDENLWESGVSLILGGRQSFTNTLRAGVRYICTSISA